MSALLNKIANDDFIWNAISAHMPKYRRSGTAFENFNCPMCMDYKPRCGVKRSTHIGVHCFAAGTMVITNRGSLPIEQLIDRTDIQIVDGNGDWTNTVFRRYGVQRLWKLVLSRNQRTQTVYTTDGHRWILSKGSRTLTTRDLKPGHGLKGLAVKPQPERQIVKDGVQHGFVFGDGHVTRQSTAASFFTPEKEALMPFFDGHHIHMGSDRKTARACGSNFKSVPSLASDPDYIFSFLAGLFAADGCVGKGKPSSATISCADIETLRSIRDLCTKVGITTYEPREMRSDVPGRYKDSPIWQMTFMRSSMPRHFFLNPKHLANYDSNTGAAYDRLGWKVVSVEETDRFEEVYCCEVSTTQSFLLENNMLTGNCFNCGFTTVYHLGQSLSRKMGEFLQRIGVSDTEVKRIALHARAIKRALEDSTFVPAEVAARTFVPNFKAMPLPEGAMPLAKWADMGCDDPDFLNAVNYALTRGDVIMREADFHWTPVTVGKYDMAKRLIVPFRWQNRIVGYTARATDGHGDKYLNYMPADYLYNNEVLDNERDYALVVEGPLDAKAIDGVSPLGSKLNENQLAWLKSSGKRIIVVADRDEAGDKMVTLARKHGFACAFPALKGHASDWWDNDIKDCDAAVKRHGRLYVLKSILETSTSNATEIEVKRRYLV